MKFIGSPENLGRDGFDIRKFSAVTPRVDWSSYLRDRHAKARLTDEQAAAMKWLAAQPGGPAKVAVIAEDWSSEELAAALAGIVVDEAGDPDARRGVAEVLCADGDAG